MFVHSFSWRPNARFDALPWTALRVEESADDETFVAVETISLTSGAVTPSGLDADPSDPAERSFTTEAATLESGYFRFVPIDASLDEGPPSASVFSPGLDADGYPALGALIAASAVSELTGLDTDQQTALRAAAITAVERFCRQSFVPEGTVAAPVTRTLDGNGADKLYLPKRLSSLVTLTVVGASINEADVEITDRHDALVIPADAVTGNYYERALADTSEPVFPVGRHGVTVSGIWGWSAAEYAAELGGVTNAIRFDMEDQATALAHQLRSTVAAARTLGLDSVNEGNVNLSLRETQPGLTVRAQRELLDLVWRSSAGAVA